MGLISTDEVPPHPEDFLVLVVDDAPQNLKVLGNILDEAGYGVTFATDGEQALERIRDSHCDLVLLDLMMPGMNGLEVCKTFRNNPDYPDPPVIFITASRAENHILQAFDIGAVDYITKPFNRPELLARVNTHLQLKHTTDRLRQTTQELREALASVERLARVDALTNVLNRRSLLEVIHQELNRSRRYVLPFSLLMLDLDRFKQVNDTYGHAAGDRALCATVERIQQIIRTVDSIGRYGGEEFVVVLPQTPLKKAVDAAERIRFAIAKKPICTDTGSFSLTASLGITTYSPQDKEVDELLKRADKALYQAKTNGRNTCCVVMASLQQPTDLAS